MTKGLIIFFRNGDIFMEIWNGGQVMCITIQFMSQNQKRAGRTEKPGSNKETQLYCRM
jgi:hypothetical protein